MSHVVELDKDGHLKYEGLLSSREIASIDEILNALKIEIPQIEKDLEETYGKGVLYKYYLGKFLSDLLKKYEISISERRKFWDEIKTFATKETRNRNEGTNAETRSFYGQCYRLAQIDKEVVEKLSWRQWQDIQIGSETVKTNEFLNGLEYKKIKFVKMIGESLKKHFICFYKIRTHPSLQMKNCL